jgi:hypothetical protein
LSLHADFRHDQVAAIARDLVVTQFHASKRLLNRSDVAAGNRRHNAHHVAFFDGRLVVLEITDVFVVHIDVNEVP